MPTIEINRVFKQYGHDTVVRGVDLRIDDGEFMVIVGPSGCGKTSVLRMVAGLEEITGGEILVDGTPVAGAHRGRRNLAMMFQDPTLYPHMSVRQNLGYPLKMAGMRHRQIEREVVAVADMLGIGQLLSRRPSQLSGGQRQRVAMGRALIRNPELMLMDEPMSNVDAKLRGELRAMIGHLHQRFGVTTLYVTHDQVEAMSLGDRVAVMRHGQIVQCGTPEQIYEHPVDAFVATFMGYPAMNLFVATVRVGGDHVSLDVAGSALPIDPARHGRLATGRDVIAGVRPHAFGFGDDGVVVDVERVETRANRHDVVAVLNVPGVAVTDHGVRVEPGPTRVTIDIDSETDAEVERWRPSHLTVDPDAIHLFDVDTGRSLTAEPAMAEIAR